MHFFGGLNNSKKNHKYLLQANQNLDLLLVPLEARNLPPARLHCHSHTAGVSRKESSPACMKIKSLLNLGNQTTVRSDNRAWNSINAG